ncbi:uncharacterized protein LOC121767384 [Salvia splendens]|uniref:uncharacterized protein LOC121767384 n=1 Tax=Salvia splendens TaxID=180675 RepID=UPI001C2771DC|nr:uncharacterized protein LOC121767384 [Salvia splendens]
MEEQNHKSYLQFLPLLMDWIAKTRHTEIQKQMLYAVLPHFPTLGGLPNPSHLIRKLRISDWLDASQELLPSRRGLGPTVARCSTLETRGNKSAALLALQISSSKEQIPKMMKGSRDLSLMASSDASKSNKSHIASDIIVAQQTIKKKLNF